jgi:DNA repair protein RadC
LSPDATIDDDIDLLAGLIGRSLRPPAARNAAASLIDAFGGLAGVAAADEAALRRGGLAKAAVADLGRVRALGIAMAREEACQRPVLSSWSALVAYLRAALAHAPREQFRTLYLDKRNILIRAEWRADDPTVQAAVERRIERLLDATAARIVSGRRDGGPVEVRGEPSSFAAAN